MNGGVAGVLLAAGESRRMGCDKLSLPLGKTTLGSLALQAALRSKLTRVYVVVRTHPAGWIDQRDSLIADSGRWQAILCGDAAQGQARSLRCGIRAAWEGNAEAAVVLLADQPCVTPGMIDRLIAAYRRSSPKADYAAACYSGLPRPPILFASRLYPDLLKLDGDQGARQLLRSGRIGDGLHIPFGDGKRFLDIDTMAAYQQALACGNDWD